MNDVDQEYGTPEARRILQLLWDPPQPTVTRGPRPRLTLDDVVRTGVEVADTEGLGALSMRKVAHRLKVGAMSLYTYVPGRSELVELMLDKVFGELALPDPVDTWQAQVETWARQTWALYLTHPWVLDHNMAQMPTGPHILDFDESLYAALSRAGVMPARISPLKTLVASAIFGTARTWISDAERARHSGVSAEVYWESRAGFWSTYFDPERYPTMTAIWEAGGFRDDEFEAMLDQLLRAVELLVPRP